MVGDSAPFMNCISGFIVLQYYEVELRLRFKMNTLYMKASIHTSNGSTAQIGFWPRPLRFLNHTELDTRLGSSGQVISPSQRPLPTQDNRTYKYKRQISMGSAGFETTIPAIKRPQTYALDRAATGTGQETSRYSKNKTPLILVHHT
jgi:hypothetical protein